MNVRDIMVEYGETAEAAVERLAELGDLDRKARKENLPSAETFVARRLGRDAKRVGAIPSIPSYTVYVDCVGPHPTPGELCEAILDGLEGRFDEIIHVEVLPR